MEAKNNLEQSVPLNDKTDHCRDENSKKPGKDVTGKVTNNEAMWTGITMEPMWFGVTVSLTMAFIGFKNLFLERACLVDLGYSREVCFESEGINKTTVELESQHIVTSILVGAGFVGGVMTSLILVFLGPWSDSSGRRKPLILLPILGMVLTSLSLLIIQYFPHVPTVWVIYAEVIPLSIGGNFSMLIMATFSYLGDICFKTGRCATTVMGTNTGVISFFMIIGSCMAPYILQYGGYKGFFALSFVLELSSLIYAYFKVNDVNIAEKIPNVLDITLPLKAFKCVFQKRDGHKRKTILLMVIVPCSNSMIFIAEISITYLYLRNKFSWTAVDYSHLLVLRGIINVIGTILIVKGLKQKLRIRDEMIGLIGAISQLLAGILMLFSFEPWLVYLSALVGILSRAVMIAERPVLNRQITALEQGKINCITAVLEKCVSFVVVPLATFIYACTLNSFPSAFLVIGVVASAIQVICYSCVDRDDQVKNDDKKDVEQATIDVIPLDT